MIQVRVNNAYKGNGIGWILLNDIDARQGIMGK